MGTITACSSRAPGLAEPDAAISQTQHRSMFSVSQPALSHAVLFITTWVGKRWMEGWTKETEMVSKLPKMTRHFIRGFRAQEQQGKEHRHAGHAEQLDLYVHPGA